MAEVRASSEGARRIARKNSLGEWAIRVWQITHCVTAAASGYLIIRWSIDSRSIYWFKFIDSNLTSIFWSGFAANEPCSRMRRIHLDSFGSLRNLWLASGYFRGRLVGCNRPDSSRLNEIVNRFLAIDNDSESVNKKVAPKRRYAGEAYFWSEFGRTRSEDEDRREFLNEDGQRQSEVIEREREKEGG